MLVKPQMVSRLQKLNNHESQCEPEDNEVSTVHDPNLISPTTKKKTTQILLQDKKRKDENQCKFQI